MRRVWGWTPASSAATEITYTARVRLFIALSPTSDPQVSPRRVGGRRRERLDGGSLFLRQAVGHRHLDGDQQVTAALAAEVKPPALDPEDLARAGARRELQR